MSERSEGTANRFESSLLLAEYSPLFKGEASRMSFYSCCLFHVRARADQAKLGIYHKNMASISQAELKRI